MKKVLPIILICFCLFIIAVIIIILKDKFIKSDKEVIRPNTIDSNFVNKSSDLDIEEILKKFNSKNIKAKLIKVLGFTDEQYNNIIIFLYVIATLDYDDYLSTFLRKEIKGDLLDTIRNTIEDVKNFVLTFLKAENVEEIFKIAYEDNYVNKIFFDDNISIDYSLAWLIEDFTERYISKQSKTDLFKKIIPSYGINIVQIAIMCLTDRLNTIFLNEKIFNIK